VRQFPQAARAANFPGCHAGRRASSAFGNRRNSIQNQGRSRLIRRVAREVARQRSEEIGVTQERSKSRPDMPSQGLVRTLYFVNDLRPAMEHGNDVFHIMAHDIIALPATIKRRDLRRQKIGCCHGTYPPAGREVNGYGGFESRSVPLVPEAKHRRAGRHDVQDYAVVHPTASGRIIAVVFFEPALAQLS
jgi:hypothetical protein